MDPLSMPLGVFDGNTAHSNQQFGLRMYSHGYFPDPQVSSAAVYTADPDVQMGVFPNCVATCRT